MTSARLINSTTDIDNAKIWLDVTEDNGQRLYLKTRLSHNVTREGFWLELEGVGLLRFAFVAFIREQAYFVAQEVCHQPFPAWTKFPSEEIPWSASEATPKEDSSDNPLSPAAHAEVPGVL